MTAFNFKEDSKNDFISDPANLSYAFKFEYLQHSYFISSETA